MNKESRSGKDENLLATVETHACIHWKPVTYLVSSPRRRAKKRLAELKDGCGGVFLFRSLSEGVEHCRDTPVPA